MYNLLAAGMPAEFKILIALSAALAAVLAVYCALLIYYNKGIFIKEYFQKSKRLQKKRAQAKAEYKKEAYERSAKYNDALVSDGFLKIKKRFMLAAIIKSAVCGISFGLITVGILLLILKINGIVINWGYYVLVGVFCALICGGVVFLFIRPANKKIAESVDNEYGLKEQIQTSLVYSRKSGAVVELQRERAEEAIKALPNRKIKFKNIWQYAVIAVAALALAFTGLFYPAKKVEGSTVGVDPVPSSPVSSFQIAGIKEIINNIKISDLNDETKNSSVDELEKFKTKLEEVMASEKEIPNSEILEVIANVDEIIAEATSYVKISEAVYGEGQIFLYNVLIDGGGAYKDVPIMEYEDVKLFNDGSYDSIDERLKDAAQSFAEWFISEQDSETISKLYEVINKINAALTASGIAQEDKLYVVLTDLAANLDIVRQSALNGELSGESLNSGIESLIIENFKVKLIDGMRTQNYYYAMDMYIGNKIKSLFGMPVVLPEEKPDDDNPGTGNNPNGNQGEHSGNENGGGGGGGNTQYGSDDEVYDWRIDEYVTYGEILDDYNALVRELMRDGDLTEEQKNMIIAYFNTLYGNSAENE